MYRSNASNDKKKALLAKKDRILQEIKYYEKRIEEFPQKKIAYYDGDSSDSDDGFPTFLETGSSLSELQHQDRLLRTCLQATQELTSVGVLQSEVNVMVQDPVIEGEKPVSEPGSWREVSAECRIDLVPFSITFYTHQPSRKFSASSYRGLRVLPVKAAHEAELSTSVLSILNNPSDAIEVLRSYAMAYRSRRTTLARLADKFANNLFMEPLAQGGFVLKCADLLEMSWHLDNKLSSVTPFHHRMNFDLEYMDESYLKIIKQAHRQLSNPTLQTDERTVLLAKIISTCLEAHTSTQQYESMDSESESVKKLERTTLTEDNERGDSLTERTDEEVMAPPKAIPKKAKPKGKENMDENRKSVKRSGSEVAGDVKKAKTVDMVKQSEQVSNNVAGKQNASEIPLNVMVTEITQKHNKVAEKVDKNVMVTEKTQKQNKIADKVVDKNVMVTEKTQKENKIAEKVVDKNVMVTEKTQKQNKIAEKVVDKNVMVTEKTQNKIAEKNVDKNVMLTEKTQKNKVAEKVGDKNVMVTEKTQKQNKVAEKVVDKNVMVTEKTQKHNVAEKVDRNKNTIAKSKVSEISDDKTSTKNVKSSKIQSNDKNNEVKKTKKVASKPAVEKSDIESDFNKVESKPVKKTNIEKNQLTSKLTNSTKNIGDKKNVKTTVKAKIIEHTDNSETVKVDSSNTKGLHDGDGNTQKIANSKNGSTETRLDKNVNSKPDKSSKNSNVLKNKVNSEQKTINTVKKITSNKNKNIEKTKIVIKNHRSSLGKSKKSIGVLKPEISSGKSKIPQKKLSPAYAAVLKQNPIRISPRMMNKFKSPSDSNIQKFLKPATNIPRLMKKPAPKSK